MAHPYTTHCCNTITKSFAHRKTLAYSHCCLAQYYRAAKLLLLGGESPKTCCVTPIKHIGDESNITLPFIVAKANWESIASLLSNARQNCRCCLGMGLTFFLANVQFGFCWVCVGNFLMELKSTAKGKFVVSFFLYYILRLKLHLSTTNKFFGPWSSSKPITRNIIE